jgi:hypothetical protein
MKIAGHTRYPKIKKAANAIPVGGQTADTFACTNAKVSPNFPAAK